MLRRFKVTIMCVQISFLNSKMILFKQNVLQVLDGHPVVNGHHSRRYRVYRIPLHPRTIFFLLRKFYPKFAIAFEISCSSAVFVNVLNVFFKKKQVQHDKESLFREQEEQLRKELEEMEERNRQYIFLVFQQKTLNFVRKTHPNMIFS